MADDDRRTPTQPGPATSAAAGRRPSLVTWIVLAAFGGGLVGAGLVAAVTHRAAAPRASGTSSAAVCTSTAVADTVLPSIVKIIASSGRSTGSGSGELIRAGGYILTNDHVIAIAGGAHGELTVLYSDGASSAATIVGRDPSTDLAVLKAADGAPGRPVIAIGDSHILRVGQPVVALGAPLGLPSTVTAGIVSALDRYLTLPADGGGIAHLIGAIQTDAAINPGNSGGALVNCAGALVGVNTAIITAPDATGTPGGGSVGLGFAIPSDLANALAAQIIATGRVSHPSTGIEAQALLPSVASRAGLPSGLYVEAVTPGSAAAHAGMASGDIITSIAGQPAVRAEQLEAVTIGKAPGDTVAIDYVRDGQSHAVTLTLTGP